ncbi:MAG TPA: hypothetical protein VF032_09380 [Thermoleophilaceae bacterium]
MIAALAAAALGVAPAAALANSSVTYSNSSGAVTVNGDSNDNNFEVTFATSSGYPQITFHDSYGGTIDPPGSGICAAYNGTDVRCTADATDPLNGIVANGNAGSDRVYTANAPAGFPLTFKRRCGQRQHVRRPRAGHLQRRRRLRLGHLRRHGRAGERECRRRGERR